MSQAHSSTSNGAHGAPTVELRPERPYRPSAGGEFHLMLRVIAPHIANPEGRRSPLDLAFIVDRSGSMAGGKLELAKRGVEHALRLLDERDTLSLTVYDDRIDIPTPQRRFSRGTYDGVLRRLRPIGARGSTDLTGGWLTGCDQLAPIADGSSPLRQVEGRPLCRALLLTDGLANVGIVEPHEIAAHAAELYRRGITTTTFGVGDSFDEVLLGQMADAGGGRYHYISGAPDVPRVFAGELGELLAVAMRDVSVSLRIPAGWQLSLLNDLPLERSGDRLRLTLGEMSSRDERILVFEATLPAASAGTREPLELLVGWSDPSGVHTVEQIVRHTLESRYEPGEPDTSVLDELARMYGSRARAEALTLNRTGRYVEANEVIQSYAKRMPSTAVGTDLAHGLEQEANAMMAPLSPAATKERHFRARNVARQQKDHSSQR